MAKTVTVVRHVHFEDLGSFEQPLSEAGYRIEYCDVGIDEISKIDPETPDLFVVLGGPIGVYETETYPFLIDEIALLKKRLTESRPTLGVCLGAQLIAAALGARVAPTGIKEIGFSPLDLTPAGHAGPLRRLASAPVLHWHGDAFEIPDGARNLASTSLCATQGFALGRNVLGLQFHPEVDAAGIERWLIGHAAELASAGIDPRKIRADATLFGAPLRDAARRMLAEWLAQLD